MLKKCCSLFFRLLGKPTIICFGELDGLDDAEYAFAVGRICCSDRSRERGDKLYPSSDQVLDHDSANLLFLENDVFIS